MVECWVTGRDCWGALWGMLCYMVESVGLYGGVLSYIVESVVLHGGCWVT